MTAAVDCGKMADLKAQQTEIERCLSKTDDIFHLLGRSVIFQRHRQKMTVEAAD